MDIFNNHGWRGIIILYTKNKLNKLKINEYVIKE